VSINVLKSNQLTGTSKKKNDLKKLDILVSFVDLKMSAHFIVIRKNFMQNCIQNENSTIK